MELKDKVIAITGAGQGLGLCMAQTLAAKGAKLALIDLNAEQLERARSAIAVQGVEVRSYAANVANESQVVTAFEQIATDFGHLNGLINNAGITRDGLLLKAKEGQVSDKMSLIQWQQVIDVNLTGVFLCGREAATQMIETCQQGVIINISSISRAGNAGQTNYSAAKAGVVAMAVTWAKELARYGIRCMAIAPGFTATEMVSAMKPEMLEKIAGQIPLGRLATPEEIAATAQFIFENDYLTGRVIDVDGGLRV